MDLGLVRQCRLRQAFDANIGVYPEPRTALHGRRVRLFGGAVVSDWEWIVLLNGKATDWSPPATDPRVKIHRALPRLRGIGALKRAACELATGEILVELDHDDLLSRGCLAQLSETFKDPQVVLRLLRLGPDQ